MRIVTCLVKKANKTVSNNVWEKVTKMYLEDQQYTKVCVKLNIDVLTFSPFGPGGPYKTHKKGIVKLFHNTNSMKITYYDPCQLSVVFWHIDKIHKNCETKVTSHVS